MNVVFVWDWKDEAPLGKILDAASQLASSGRLFHWEPDTGGDCYACVLSDHALSSEQIERVLFPDEDDD